MLATSYGVSFRPLIALRRRRPEQFDRFLMNPLHVIQTQLFSHPSQVYLWMQKRPNELAAGFMFALQALAHSRSSLLNLGQFFSSPLVATGLDAAFSNSDDKEMAFEQIVGFIAQFAAVITQLKLAHALPPILIQRALNLCQRVGCFTSFALSTL